ncbi:hypothetical protein PoB_001086300 [Plakobranchus ocellatus]|uniref:Uncharacterized protein n=1 Tax=Plakobranchus ocellatus TaxID=259542 RepID=A0AAV3YPT7_9GAST|nr:hypothetical protein PoB_001086300 [Plakobranchus ocellatus]
MSRLRKPQRNRELASGSYKWVQYDHPGVGKSRSHYDKQPVPRPYGKACENLGSGKSPASQKQTKKEESQSVENPAVQRDVDDDEDVNEDNEMMMTVIMVD